MNAPLTAEQRTVHFLNRTSFGPTRETVERAEFYVHELQKYQLHATMEPGE